MGLQTESPHTLDSRLHNGHLRSYLLLSVSKIQERTLNSSGTAVLFLQSKKRLSARKLFVIMIGCVAHGVNRSSDSAFCKVKMVVEDNSGYY